jgi:hypothetical protein
MIGLEKVLDRVIRGMVRRVDMIVACRSTVIADAPGMFRWVVERLGVGRANVDAAIALVYDGRTDMPLKTDEQMRV